MNALLLRQKFVIGDRVICVNDQTWVSVADGSMTARGPKYGDPVIVSSYFQAAGANFITIEGYEDAFNEKYFIGS